MSQLGHINFTNDKKCHKIDQKGKKIKVGKWDENEVESNSVIWHNFLPLITLLLHDEEQSSRVYVGQ